MPIQLEGRRNEITKLRRIYWFHGARIALNVTSANRLAKIFEGPNFGKKDGIPYHSKKWERYEWGLRTPRKLVTDRVDQRVPGASNELNHVLWSILSGEKIQTKKWIAELSHELQSIVSPAGVIQLNGGTRFLEKIERMANLDALACLTLLLRLSVENQDHASAWSIAASTFRMLLMLGSRFHSRQIGSELFKFYTERIFNEVTFKGQRMRLETYPFIFNAQLLEICSRYRVQGNNRKMVWHEQTFQMFNLLHLRTGNLEAFFIFSPLIGPDLQIGPPKEKDLKEYQAAILRQNNAKDRLMLDANSLECFP